MQMCTCCRAKGKPPVGGVSIFGGVTDELIGVASTEPEESTITSTPPAPSKPAVTSTVSVALTYFLYALDNVLTTYNFWNMCALYLAELMRVAQCARKAVTGNLRQECLMH